MAKQLIVYTGEEALEGSKLHSFITSTSLYFLFKNNLQKDNLTFEMELDPYQAGWLYGGTKVEALYVSSEESITALHNFAIEKKHDIILLREDKPEYGFVVTPAADGKIERIINFAETLLKDESQENEEFEDETS